MEVRITEEQRQLVLLALAKLSHSRPGFDYALGETADAFAGRKMYEEFKSFGPDPVRHPSTTEVEIEKAGESIRAVRKSFDRIFGPGEERPIDLPLPATAPEPQ